ncbi:MAG TPA: SUMF1/EgtB/PvdO family nonheme iron enzyme, partial [Terriglobia bacterium]|nr:SUMF1/EgtB/PvdO family nonheme iron enzyme [Terriglobia bacterium]
EEELAWFDTYLFKPGESPNEAFKDDSPLAQELKRKAIARVEANYGVKAGTTLVPETVKYQGLEIGRFEVTRAQYAEFDKSYTVESGKGNFPANGISFEQAKAYCVWLSNLTGSTYHVGSEAEMQPLYSSAKGNENTLDYWAGYAPNPDDAQRLSSKIEQLDGNAPLLREVGTFKGRGEDALVFDLGGNVAEWAVGKDGDGKVLGGSADQPADSRRADSAAAPAYVGFRVVRAKP